MRTFLERRIQFLLPACCTSGSGLPHAACHSFYSSVTDVPAAIFHARLVAFALHVHAWHRSNNIPCGWFGHDGTIYRTGRPSLSVPLFTDTWFWITLPRLRTTVYAWTVLYPLVPHAASRFWLPHLPVGRAGCLPPGSAVWFTTCQPCAQQHCLPPPALGR